MARGGDGDDSPSISSALPSKDIDKRTREDGVRCELSSLSGHDDG
jgi:hypothetical protein